MLGRMSSDVLQLPGWLRENSLILDSSLEDGMDKVTIVVTPLNLLGKQGSVAGIDNPISILTYEFKRFLITKCL